MADNILVCWRRIFISVSYTHLDVDGSAAQADFVIEAIVEDLKVKRELFARISKICRPDAVLSTNSSNIVSSKLADVTEHPERLMNVHYFNPALAMKLVELVRGAHTSDETVEMCIRDSARTAAPMAPAS